ncbi:MAG: hypothetical protein ACYTGB_03285 [Planctomycetota bacterium]|jgi:hypothetical protein
MTMSASPSRVSLTASDAAFSGSGWFSMRACSISTPASSARARIASRSPTRMYSATSFSRASVTALSTAASSAQATATRRTG